MEILHLLKAIGALCLVAGLLLSVLFIMRKIYPTYISAAQKNTSKLRYEEQIVLSPKHRLVVVSYGQTKYLLLLGNSEVVVDKIEECGEQ